MSPVNEHRFKVFGASIAVAPGKDGWRTFILGSDGTRRPAGFVVPSFIKEDELGQYLADVLHELATPGNNQVVKLR